MSSNYPCASQNNVVSMWNTFHPGAIEVMGGGRRLRQFLTLMPYCFRQRLGEGERGRERERETYCFSFVSQLFHQQLPPLVWTLFGH